jgi:hypothetical protein
MCQTAQPAANSSTPTGTTSSDPLTALRQQFPDYDFAPLLDLLGSQSAEGYEAFFNHVAELVCWHLKDGEWDNKLLLRTLLELFHLRDTFRTMRGGPVWK